MSRDSVRLCEKWNSRCVCLFVYEMWTNWLVYNKYWKQTLRKVFLCEEKKGWRFHWMVAKWLELKHPSDQYKNGWPFERSQAQRDWTEILDWTETFDWTKLHGLFSECNLAHHSIRTIGTVIFGRSLRVFFRLKSPCFIKRHSIRVVDLFKTGSTKKRPLFSNDHRKCDTKCECVKWNYRDYSD